ncbi:monovalent cation/H+ antiporter subunit A [Pelagibacterium sp. H642]|uniref:monovalent cation/H+ antiporter subunit A n=1 Tax=Pelagibacterium sp. H642 TaxID=1881069 RepID=UPI002815A8D3|nr:monovalent cation/H+ antiporter subunit A [Pelagibacterium sp. H642]WMT89025.1 monovalent cation/H+ antiporter subunit A [Pelagibacterium sp. H642]
MEPALGLVFIIGLPFTVSLVMALGRFGRSVSAWWSLGVAVACFALVIGLYPAIATGAVLRYEIPWVPSIGLSLTFRMDGFTWLFSALVTGVGALVMLYARYYMSPDDPVRRFFAFLLAFMGSMLGVVLSGNVIQLVIFWEITSLFSFLLIGYWYHNPAARDGARMALTITASGGLCLMAGMILLGHISGSYDLDAILASREAIQSHDLYGVTLILILLGAFTKSAQFPFQFWLPNAMAAPTPVSAYLHSATMVKLGVFLLALLWPVLAGTDMWFWIVGSVGSITLILGAYAAIFQQDLKGLLAYSTISHLGLITLLLGMSSPLAAVAAIFHIVNHATFKASLFMAAGIIDHETGTRDLRKLSGLFRLMPITATAAMVASAAMGGVPLLNGFLSKEMFFAETLEVHNNSILDQALPYIATLGGLFSVVYSIRFIAGVFFGPEPLDLPRDPHEPPRWMRVPVELLVVACLLVGVIPGITIGPFLATAVASVLGPDVPYYSLSVWHGFTLELLMSLIALIGGIAVYFAIRGPASRLDGPPVVRHLKGQRMFERFMVTISWKLARSLENILGTRRLQTQIGIVILTVLAAGFAVVTRSEVSGVTFPLVTFDPVFALIWAVGAACAIGAAHQAKFHRFAALVLMSGAGLVTVLTFVWFSAPDLAITQLLVEIVTTVLILLGLRWMPKRQPDLYGTRGWPLSVVARRGRDLAIAVAVGLSTAVIAYFVMTRDLADTVATYFLELAYPEGGGRNVVNVILVDFRGFDTFGEIVVLGIVALSVFALLRRFRPAPESMERPEQQRRLIELYGRGDSESEDGGQRYMPIASVIMHWMFPVIIVLAAYLFFRGHDAPGGGFAAGVAMSIGFLLQYMAGGTRWVEDRLRVLPVRWIAVGLLIALGTGAGAWIFGYPFLTSFFQYTEIPFIGRVPTASALLFDLGVFVLVVGATVLMLVAIAHQSIRKPKIRPSIEDDEEAPELETPILEKGDA